ncbi:peptidase E [Prochlorococcus sp. MIT 1223]|uniref:Type 1 glutamine amidotransferase-like domain-containing protein n=1 Tax=Prochlorococcus sp. MIT 1223 TaxID=3096217 RepID=UPI002A766325|nr:peptidase E [Prochlorococcus sp. MIT 1223]
MNKDKNIIAIGGGGFGRSLRDLKIERYITNLSKVKNPNICFIPTATGDSDTYKVSFYNVFTKLECKPTHIDLFKRTIDLEDHINKQDIIYVGGGNTKSMLAVWKEWGLDLILKNAYDAGVIMSGVSAGAICWFTKGITDSWEKELSILECLDFVRGTCCPHYDEEESRIPYVTSLLLDKHINSCIAIEDNCALHLKNGEPFRSISFGDKKNSYFVSLNKKNIISKPYTGISI